EAKAAEAAVAEAVNDVHGAVADVDAMRAMTLGLAKQLEVEPPPNIDMATVEGVQKLLVWVARRHFVFLGAAVYDRDGEGWRVREDSRLGLLRRDATMDPPPAAHRALLSIARSGR